MKKNQFLAKTFLWMAIGLIVTGLVTYWVLITAQTNIQFAIRINNAWWWILFIQLFISIGIAGFFEKANKGMLIMLYLAYCGLTGLWMGPLMYIYNLETIILSLVATVFLFAGVSIFGLITKKDLSSWGAFGMILLFGFIIASFFNFLVWFFNPALASSVNLILTYVVLLGILALLAFSMQKLQEMGRQLEQQGGETGKFAIIGAFNLYLSFINIFLSVLRIFGR